MPLHQNRHFTRRTVLKASAAGSAAAVLAQTTGFRPAFAQDASPVADNGGMPPLPPGATLIAQGLLGPRYLAIDTDGSIYVTEAGMGGDEQLFMPAEEATPVAADATPAPRVPVGTRGYTGQVSKIAADGTVSVVASGIASYNAEGPVGPAGIVLADGKIWIGVGGAGPGTPLVDPLDTENAVLSIDPATGQFTKVADIRAFEVANNPDPWAIDSDVYGIALNGDGKLIVADAGGNTVYTVDPASGDVQVLAVIPGIELPADQVPPGGNPARGGGNDIDPVPTGVAVGPDGDVYVSLLSGGPFPPGGAKVQKIAADGSVSDAVTGLTMATGIVWGPDSQWYVVQLSTNFLGAQPAPGNVSRVKADGSLEIVVDNLFLPNGIAFDGDGNLYITIGTATPAGAVIRVDGIAAPSGSAATPTS